MRNTSGLRRGGPGRPKGVPNKVTVEVREAASALVDDPVYRKKLRDDLRKRKLAPAVEVLLWHYAKGKPKETIDVDLTNRVQVLGEEEVRRMTDEELAAAAKALAATAAALAASFDE
jgi:hypothetical protein